MGRGGKEDIFRAGAFSHPRSKSFLQPDLELKLRTEMRDTIDWDDPSAGYYKAMYTKVIEAKKFYHVAPTSERNRIKQHGLIPSRPNLSGNWGESGEGLNNQPEGVYLLADHQEAQGLASSELSMGKNDIWEISPHELNDLEIDWEYPSAFSKAAPAVSVPHRLNPRLNTGYEMTIDVSSYTSR